jgi:hypothetical protein
MLLARKGKPVFSEVLVHGVPEAARCQGPERFVARRQAGVFCGEAERLQGGPEEARETMVVAHAVSHTPRHLHARQQGMAVADVIEHLEARLGNPERAGQRSNGPFRDTL